jgi:hypothetical protein
MNTKNYEPEAVEDYSPFFLLYHNKILNYSPVVLIPNYEWYDSNGLNYYSETYIPEIKINGSVVDLTGYTHLDLVTYGVDWNVLGYGMHSFHNLTYSISSGSHVLLATDSIVIEIKLDAHPLIAYENSMIEFGIIDEYHYEFTNEFKYSIYPDGLVLYSIYLADEIVTYEGWITVAKYEELLDLMWSYNFIYFKNFYLGPDDDIFFDTSYYTMVALGNESYYKFFMGPTAPVVTGELWDAIYAEVLILDYVTRDPVRPFGKSGWLGLSWRAWGSIFGVTGALMVIGLVAQRFRK